MTDNVAVTEGAGKTMSTDERTINSATVHVQRINDIGGSAIANGHVTVTNSNADIVAARETRKQLIIANYQTVPIYIGVSAVTTSNGIRLDPGSTITLNTTAAVQGITSAAYSAVGEDDKVHYIEVYDA